MTTREKLPIAFMQVHPYFLEELPLSEEEESEAALVMLAISCALDQWTKQESRENNDWISISYSDILYATLKVHDEYLKLKK